MTAARRLRARVAIAAASLSALASCGGVTEPDVFDPLVRPTSPPAPTSSVAPTSTGAIPGSTDSTLPGQTTVALPTSTSSTTTTTTTAVTTTTLGVFPDNFAGDAQLTATCGGPCREEAAVRFDHPTLGPGRVSWLSVPSGGSLGAYFLFGLDRFDVRWGRGVTDSGARVVEASIDGLGHVFFRLRLANGKAAMVVLVPTRRGFTDLTTLDLGASPWVCDSATLVDAGGQHAVMITFGTDRYEYRWDGSTYINVT